MSIGSAARDDLHRMIDELSDEKIGTAKRFLTTLKKAEPHNDVIKQFLEGMSAEDAALLDAMAALDDQLGAPPLVEPDAEQQA